MLGHKYKSQDIPFRASNREIKTLLIKQLLKSKNDIKKPVVIGERISQKVDKVWEYIILYQIDALKDPLFYEIFGVYWNVSPIFRKQKFIWTHRDPLEAAKSAVRLKQLKNVPEGPLTEYTVQARLKKIDGYNQVHEHYFPKCDGINVHFEQLLSDPDKIGLELSDFLGREIDMSEVNPKETYKVAKTPQ